MNARIYLRSGAARCRVYFHRRVRCFYSFRATPCSTANKQLVVLTWGIDDGQASSSAERPPPPSGSCPLGGCAARAVVGSRRLHHVPPPVRGSALPLPSSAGRRAGAGHGCPKAFIPAAGVRLRARRAPQETLLRPIVLGACAGLARSTPRPAAGRGEPALGPHLCMRPRPSMPLRGSPPLQYSRQAPSLCPVHLSPPAPLIFCRLGSV